MKTSLTYVSRGLYVSLLVSTYRLLVSPRTSNLHRNLLVQGLTSYLSALARSQTLVTYGYLLADPPRRYRIKGWLDANEMRTSGAVRDEGTFT